MSEFLTLQQAADLAGVNVAQIRVRIAMGELTPKPSARLLQPGRQPIVSVKPTWFG